MSRKQRSDSKLKTLPAAVQAELFELCKGPGGYAQAREWLAEKHGLLVKSDATFSNFFGWYPFSLSATASYAQQFEREMAKLPELQGDAEKLSRLGQVGFEMLAMRMQDLEGYATLRKLRLKERDQHLVERRIRLLEQKAEQADKAKAVSDDAALSDEEKLQRFRQIFGAS